MSLLFIAMTIHSTLCLSWGLYSLMCPYILYGITVIVSHVHMYGHLILILYVTLD